MYFLAAPFLAIAVYYLLQLVTGVPYTSLLVLMAFATGFMSDAVVRKIMDFGKQMLEKARADDARKTEQSGLAIASNSPVTAAPTH